MNVSKKIEHDNVNKSHINELKVKLTDKDTEIVKLNSVINNYKKFDKDKKTLNNKEHTIKELKIKLEEKETEVSSLSENLNKLKMKNEKCYKSELSKNNTINALKIKLDEITIQECANNLDKIKDSD
jgi:predicted RNase H-like nuclease (RuvC/YqgF family)